MAPSESAGPEPATPLATGRTADVWLLPGGRVLRRYRDGGDVRAEAEVMRHLHRAGYPVPRVHHADGADLVLDRVSGPTLVEAFHAGAVAAPAAARMLADLHDRLHALPALRSADPAVRILHLDLHPDNVLLTATGPVVIDWTDSAEGPPALDRTTTALILAEVAVAPGHPLAAAAGELLSAYAAVSGPLDRPAEAVRHRAAGHAPDPQRLPEAAALLAETIRAVAPARERRASQPSSPPRSRS
ncbi:MULTISPECIES: phosphotransferase [unclassified Micromonospora]|uniref:phosphotransferase n=1 Tax=unclassified Micromonospora TaxID=2617518 RepID=UPI001B38C867|nr:MULTISPECIES: phosphotransferase [unclassified Micromonospora]MBQ1041237.1 phosphotransferase [Micromonospora sp. C72]MBQ1054963.1 phosphotransferase [Micromonospora sp. C32]